MVIHVGLNMRNSVFVCLCFKPYSCAKLLQPLTLRFAYVFQWLPDFTGLHRLYLRRSGEYAYVWEYKRARRACLCFRRLLHLSVTFTFYHTTLHPPPQDDKRTTWQCQQTAHYWQSQFLNHQPYYSETNLSTPDSASFYNCGFYKSAFVFCPFQAVCVISSLPAALLFFARCGHPLAAPSPLCLHLCLVVLLIHLSQQMTGELISAFRWNPSCFVHLRRL